MKIYLVKLSNVANQAYNFDAWADVESVEGGFYVKSIQAFLKKKHAREYIKKLCRRSKYLDKKDREIITVEVK